MTAIALKRHGTIFAEGQFSNRVYIMLSGVAKLSILNREERVLVGLVGPGEVFGVSSLLPNAIGRFDAMRLPIARRYREAGGFSSTTTLGISRELLSRMLDATVGRWWMMLIRYADFVGLGLRERLAGALLEVGTKFGVEDSRGVLLTTQTYA